MSSVVRIVGIALVVLLICGAFLVALLALQNGHVFVWRNYWNNPIAASTLLTTFGLMGVIGAIWVAQRAWRWFRGRSDRSV